MAKRSKRGCGCLFAAIIIAAIGALAWFLHAGQESEEAEPLPNASAEVSWWDENFDPFVPQGELVTLSSIATGGGRGAMHSDAAQSDVHDLAAPFGEELIVKSRLAGGKLLRQCSTFTFLGDGKLVAMCGGMSGFRLTLIDPADLSALATHDLGMRSSALESLITQDLSHTFSDSSGGAYFVLDAQDRVIVGDPRQRIKRIAVRKRGSGWAFEVEDEWDMREHVPSDCLWFTNWFPSEGGCDGITTVMPWTDGRLWWTTRGGIVGTLDPQSGAVQTLKLDGEEIQNAFAADENAVFVLSDHAQYALVPDTAGKPQVEWHHAYDRGSARKLGSINQGSGTTPTLLGERYITFTDNADERINLLVLLRDLLPNGEQREICRVPIFAAGASVAENSMIGLGRSIVIENNSGYTNAFDHEDWSAIKGGVARIDIREDESGCDTIWESDLVVPSVVPKLSAQTGIAYFYSFDLDEAGLPQWYIAGLDWNTGKLVQRIPTGAGAEWNNNWSSIAIGPDGALYVGTTRGMMQVNSRRWVAR